METLQEMLQQIDWKVLLPVITFILGAIVTFIVTFFKDYLDRRREIGNMKEIIFQELLHNYGLVNQIKSKDPDTSPEAFFYLIGCISISVYEAYIDRLNSLQENEVLEVLSAYRDLYEFFNHKERVSYFREEDKSTFGLSSRILNKPIIDCAENAVDSIKAAILALDPEGGQITLDKYHKLMEEQESS
jgi:hypothetical protein